MQITPVEQHGAVWIKRDDLYTFGGVNGGKARATVELARGAKGLVTFGSRTGIQLKVVAAVAAKLGIQAVLHIPWSSSDTPTVTQAIELGALVIRHKMGRMNVLASRAAKYAEAKGYTLIPFGLDHHMTRDFAAKQTTNIPGEVKRIVVPCGSGTHTAGIDQGLVQAGRYVPILAVQVGADPTKRLVRHAAFNWRSRITLASPGTPYDEPAAERCVLDGVSLDPWYEGKCLPFLLPGDLLWVVGHR